MQEPEKDQNRSPDHHSTQHPAQTKTYETTITMRGNDKTTYIIKNNNLQRVLVQQKQKKLAQKMMEMQDASPRLAWKSSENFQGGSFSETKSNQGSKTERLNK